MTFFNSITWTIISFTFFTALVAIISSVKTRGDKLDSAEGYFLAGRGLSGIVIAGSLLLTNLSAEQLVGLNGQSWKSNMGPIAWEVGSMFTLLVLAYYFLPRYLKMGAMTIPSLMEVRYGKSTKTMFSLVIPGLIAFYLPSIQGAITAAGDKAIDFAYPALIAAIIPKPIMGFFAAAMFGAILSSFNSVLNSASTMFTLDLYRSTFDPSASDAKCVKVGKIYGTIAGCVSVVIAPFVMNAQGITTFLNSMSQFVSLPVLCAVLGVFLFKRLPAYTPKVITIFHVVCYGAFLLAKPCYPGTENPIHYLYAMAVLFPVELLIMWALNKYRPGEEYVPQDVGAVDLTPWKYRHVVSIIGLLLAVAIYILFSPLGIAA